VIDTQDADQRARLQRQGLTVITADTIMTDIEKSVALARLVVEQGRRVKRKE
jgi:hypothetical protein